MGNLFQKPQCVTTICTEDDVKRMDKAMEAVVIVGGGVKEIGANVLFEFSVQRQCGADT